MFTSRGYLTEMREKNIKYINFSSVDNLLLNNIDESFIGSMVFNDYKISSKSIFKEDGKSKDFVFCKYSKKPFMLDYYYINDSISVAKDENKYLYRDINILVHLIDIELVESFANQNLPYHRAFRPYNYYTHNKEYVKTEKPNCFKFEKFIFDAFYFANDMLIYRVDSSSEFAPIKNKSGINTPENAINLYEKYCKKNITS